MFIQKIWSAEIISTPDKANIDYYNHPIGSGPFQFKYRKNDEKIVLASNNQYYNKCPSLNEVVFTYQPDKEKAWTRLLSGATDIVQEISPKNYEIMKQYEKQFYIDQYPLKYYSIMLYNTHCPLFSDLRIRQALSYAIDKKYIVDHILNGYAKIAVGPMGVDSPFRNPAIKPFPYDPQQSIKLLRQIGWNYEEKDRYLCKDGKIFEFNLLVPKEYQIEKTVAQFIKVCLNDIGIKMNIRAIPLDELSEKYNMNDEFQAVLTEFPSAYNSPEYLKEIWSSCASGRSRAGCFSQPDIDALLGKIIKAKDPAQTKNYMYKVDALITTLQPGTFLFHKTAIDAMSKRFYLPFPFTLSHPGIFRLQFVSLAKK